MRKKIVQISLFCVIAPIIVLGKDFKKKMSKIYNERVEISSEQSKRLKNGFEIKFLKQEFSSIQPSKGSSEISTPAAYLDIFYLNLSFGKLSKEIVLSHSDGGMVSKEWDDFEGHKISYVNHKVERGKTILKLEIEQRKNK